MRRLRQAGSHFPGAPLPCALRRGAISACLARFAAGAAGAFPGPWPIWPTGPSATPQLPVCCPLELSGLCPFSQAIENTFAGESKPLEQPGGNQPTQIHRSRAFRHRKHGLVFRICNSAMLLHVKYRLPLPLVQWQSVHHLSGSRRIPRLHRPWWRTRLPRWKVARGISSHRGRGLRGGIPFFIELAHPPEVLRGEATEIRVSATDVGGERNDGGLAPAIGNDATADIFTHLPIQTNQLGVDGLKRAYPRARSMSARTSRNDGSSGAAGIVPPRSGRIPT